MNYLGTVKILTVGSLGNSIIELFTVVIIFVAVLALSVVTTRWIGGYEKSKSIRQNLELKESIRFGNNKTISIVRAGVDKYLVVACGKDEINILATLTSDEIIEYNAETDGKLNSSYSTMGLYGDAFRKIFEKAKKDSGPKKDEDSEAKS